MLGLYNHKTSYVGDVRDAAYRQENNGILVIVTFYCYARSIQS